MSYDKTKLINPKSQPDGSIICACPQCQKEGHDKQKQHLKIWKNGAYNCSKYGDDILHNKAIKILLCGFSGDDDFEYIEEPKLTVEKIYPESSLSTLLPDYSYWVGRGIKEEVLKELEGGLAPQGEKGKLVGRYIFPIRNLQGKIMGFTGRIVISNSFSTLWKHCFRSSKAVYPWNVTGDDIKKSKTVILTESLGDAMSLISVGIKPVLCIFGLNLNGLIISTLVGASVERIIISLNKDEDENKGRAAAERIARKLTLFFSRVEIRLPVSFKDWNEALTGGETGMADLMKFKEEIEVK